MLPINVKMAADVVCGVCWDCWIEANNKCLQRMRAVLHRSALSKNVLIILRKIRYFRQNAQRNLTLVQSYYTTL